MADAKHGLILALPGAPNTPHSVYDSAGNLVPGHYSPEVITPVGGDGDLTLGAAQSLAADPAVHLELRVATAAEVKAARAYWEAWLPVLRGGLAGARDRATGVDAERLADTITAAAPEKYEAPNPNDSQEG